MAGLRSVAVDGHVTGETVFECSPVPAGQRRCVVLTAGDMRAEVLVRLYFNDLADVDRFAFAVAEVRRCLVESATEAQNTNGQDVANIAKRLAA